MTTEAAPSQTPPSTPSTSKPTPAPAPPSTPTKSTPPMKAQDFRSAANDVERTDIGGNFHISGKGFGSEVGSVIINGRNAYVLLSNKEPHVPMWDDENIYGQLPPMSVSGEVIVTMRDGSVQRGMVRLADRFVGNDPRADVTDDKPHHPNA